MANANLEALIDLWDAKLRDAFIEAIMQLRDAAQIGLIVTMIEQGDVEGAVKAVGLDPLQFRGFDRTLSEGYEAAGQAAVDAFPSTKDADGHRLAILFDVRSFRAEQWLRRRSSRMITEIIDDQRVLIRQHLEAGMAAGVNPRAVAIGLVGQRNPVTGRREGGVIGLTTTQGQWANAYAQDLATLNPRALARSLRDKRFDSTVRKALATKSPIPAQTRSKMIAAYRNRALQYRGESIARTEAMTSLHQAQQEATEQAIEKGQFTADAVTKVWHSARDIRVREQHRHLDGQKVPYRGVFRATDGSELRFPGDPNAPPSETINCRCWMEMRVNFLKGVK